MTARLFALLLFLTAALLLWRFLRRREYRRVVHMRFVLLAKVLLLTVALMLLWRFLRAG